MAPEPIPSKTPAKRILVVDDEPHVAKTIKMVLSLSGHAVDVAEDADQALKLYAVGKYDLVITDFALGKTTGLDLARLIRGQSPAQPIFLITAYGESLEFQEERLRYVNLLIGKPFSIEEMQAALARIFAPS